MPRRDNAEPPGFARLTPRELEVLLRLVARRLSNAEIASELIIGESNDQDPHEAPWLAKLGLRDRVRASIVAAYEAGLVAPGDLAGASAQPDRPAAARRAERVVAVEARPEPRARAAPNAHPDDLQNTMPLARTRARR